LPPAAARVVVVTPGVGRLDTLLPLQVRATLPDAWSLIIARSLFWACNVYLNELLGNGRYLLAAERDQSVIGLMTD